LHKHTGWRNIAEEGDVTPTGIKNQLEIKKEVVNSIEDLFNLYPNMRICVIATEREEELKKEEVATVGRLEIQPNMLQLDNTRLDKQINSRPLLNNSFSSPVAITHIRIPNTKRLRELLVSDGRITLWIGREVKEALLKSGINVSEFVREKLKEELAKRNIQVNYPEPDLIVEVRCPKCNFHQETTSITYVRCRNCHKAFRVYTRNARPRIVRIVKGDKSKLFKKYYQHYR
jgi:hypothetical protein